MPQNYQPSKCCGNTKQQSSVELRFKFMKDPLNMKKGIMNDSLSPRSFAAIIGIYPKKIKELLSLFILLHLPVHLSPSLSYQIVTICSSIRITCLAVALPVYHPLTGWRRIFCCWTAVRMRSSNVI